jgi:hypothetical protein
MFFLVRFRPMAHLDFLLPLFFYKWYRGSAYLFSLTQIWFLSSVWYSCHFEDVKYCGILIKILMTMTFSR